MRECTRPKNQISESLDKSSSTDPTLSSDAQLKYENNQLKLSLLELRCISSRARLNIEGIKTETDDEDGPLPSNLRECIRPKNQISENLDKSTSTDPTLSNDAQLKYENNQLKLALELRYFFFKCCT